MQRGASNSKFLNYINKHLLPVFEKVSLNISHRPVRAFLLAKLETRRNVKNLYFCVIN